MPAKKKASPRVRDAIQKKLPANAYGKIPASGRVPAMNAKQISNDDGYTGSRARSIKAAMDRNPNKVGAYSAAQARKKREASPSAARKKMGGTRRTGMR